MHDQFADWYQPATFGHDRDTIELRWQGIEAVLEEIDIFLISELTRFVFGQKLSKETTLEEFRHFFKNVDQTFKSTGNEEEVLVLAGCVLATLCDKGDVPTLLSILTTSALGNRVIKVNIDLVNMAESQLHIQSLKDRIRPNLERLNTVLETKEVKEAVKLVTEDPNPANAGQSLKVLAPFYQQLVSHQKKTVDYYNKLLNQLRVQDEELQILWWVISGWSNMWSSVFEALDEKTRPILLAKEVSTITTGKIEPPSIKAIFYRVGIQEQSVVTIPEAVNTCSVDVLKKLNNEKVSCPILFPLHFAVSRAIETDGKQTWISAWSDVSGINKKNTISLLDLAIQMFHECKLIELF